MRVDRLVSIHRQRLPLHRAGDSTSLLVANDLELTRRVSNSVDVPVIASGGAGTIDHFAEAFTIGRADAALAASVFHFEEISIAVLKSYLRMRGLEVRL